MTTVQLASADLGGCEPLAPLPNQVNGLTALSRSCSLGLALVNSRLTSTSRRGAICGSRTVKPAPVTLSESNQAESSNADDASVSPRCSISRKRANRSRSSTGPSERYCTIRHAAMLFAILLFKGNDGDWKLLRRSTQEFLNVAGAQPWLLWIGRYTRKAAPWPGSLSTVIAPPAWAAIAWHVARPSPVPRPPLVENSGSNMRD